MTDQKQSALDWEDVRVFVGLARYGSLSATARALGLTHATVSRRVRALERTLGEKLLERRSDGYRLTAIGQGVIGPAIEMEAASSRLGRNTVLSGDTLRGLVRVNAPPSLSQSFLAARLARLASRHPGLELDVVGDLRTVSLERRETDLGIRFEKPKDGDVIARRLGDVGYGYYGTKVWPRRLEEGTEPVFIGFDEANAHLRESRWLAQHFPRARCALRTSNHLAQAEAAATGLSIALLPHFVGDAYPKLKPCALEPQPPTRALWLIKRRQDRDNPAVQAVWDHLLEMFDEEPWQRSEARASETAFG